MPLAIAVSGTKIRNSFNLEIKCEVGTKSCILVCTNVSRSRKDKTRKFGINKEGKVFNLQKVKAFYYKRVAFLSHYVLVFLPAFSSLSLLRISFSSSRSCE